MTRSQQVVACATALAGAIRTALKSRSRSIGRQTDRFASKVEHDVNVGGYIDPHAGRVTVREFGQQWRVSQLQHAVSTARDVEGALRVHLYPALGDRPIGSVRPSDVQGWVAGLTKTLGPRP